METEMNNEDRGTQRGAESDRRAWIHRAIYTASFCVLPDSMKRKQFRN